LAVVLFLLLLILGTALVVAKILSLSSAPIVVLRNLPLRLVGIAPAVVRTLLPSSVPNAEARSPKQQHGIALAVARILLPSSVPNAEARNPKQQLGIARSVGIRTSRQNSVLNADIRGRDNCEYEIRKEI
jgi:hypothetical protein